MFCNFFFKLAQPAIKFASQFYSSRSTMYDYRGTGDVFAKVNTFKKTTFRVAETSLTVEQIKKAAKALIAMGVTGTPESGNAIAAALRELATTASVQAPTAAAWTRTAPRSFAATTGATRFPGASRPWRTAAPAAPA